MAEEENVELFSKITTITFKRVVAVAEILITLLFILPKTRSLQHV